jgi:hypothetical protein
MNRFIILFFILSGQCSLADGLEEDVKHLTDSLKSKGIEKLFVHQYSLFNGRYEIPYDDKELRCDNVPTVVHIFWDDNGQWRCLRLDNCGRFEVIPVAGQFDDLPIDENIELKKKSAHFTKYKLTKFSKDDQISVSISGTQLRDDRNPTTRTFKRVNKLIRGLERSHRFSRVK